MLFQQPGRRSGRTGLWRQPDAWRSSPGPRKNHPGSMTAAAMPRFTFGRGEQQLLPGSGAGLDRRERGRADPRGDTRAPEPRIVWEYVNSLGEIDGVRKVGIVTHATRYRPRGAGLPARTGLVAVSPEHLPGSGETQRMRIDIDKLARLAWRCWASPAWRWSMAPWRGNGAGSRPATSSASADAWKALERILLPDREVPRWRTARAASPSMSPAQWGELTSSSAIRRTTPGPPHGPGRQGPARLGRRRTGQSGPRPPGAPAMARATRSTSSRTGTTLPERRHPPELPGRLLPPMAAAWSASTRTARSSGRSHADAHHDHPCRRRGLHLGAVPDLPLDPAARLRADPRDPPISRRARC